LSRTKPALHIVLLFAAALLGSASSALAGVTVTLTAPANNSGFLAPANITLSATASANQGYTLSKVEFFHGTTLIGTDIQHQLEQRSGGELQPDGEGHRHQEKQR
jgi:methionine-rich copper-binding protein CopC